MRLKAPVWIVTRIWIAAGVGVAMDSGGVAVGWGMGEFVVGRAEGVAMATGVAGGRGAGVAVGVEAAVGCGVPYRFPLLAGWLVAHLTGATRCRTAERRVCDPCMMRSVPPT